VLPSGRPSLLAGPSGAGKTTWFLQTAQAWLEGEPVLGKETYRPLVHVADKCPKGCADPTHWKAGTILYIAADRGEKDTEETMDRVLRADSPMLTNPDYGFEWRSILGNPGLIPLFDLLEEKSSVKIVFIEGAVTL